MYDISKLFEAKSIKDAIRLLGENPKALVLAGGSDVLIKMREGKLAGAELVSLYKVDELRGIHMSPDGTITIKPLTSFSHITQDPIIQKYIPTLGEAVDQVGGPQVRNIGTIGGNICNGVTSADSASTLFCLDAELEITGAEDFYTLPIKDFYKGPGKVALNQGELLTAIRIKKESYEGFFGHYIKYSMRRAMDIATLGCSASVKLKDDKMHIDTLHLAFGVAAPTPIRATNTEMLAAGAKISETFLEELGASALLDVNPRTSWRASKEFRLQLVEELTKRAVKEAILKAGGVF